MEIKVNGYEKLEINGGGGKCFCRDLYQVATVSVNYRLWLLAEGEA